MNGSEIHPDARPLWVALALASTLHALLLMPWPATSRPATSVPPLELRLLTRDAADRRAGPGELSLEERYIEHWRRTMEGFGTRHFPKTLPMQARAAPVLELAVRADGSLAELQLLRSSGQRALDQAAIEMLRAASPFTPFPVELAAQRSSLRFAYEWRFETGERSF